MHISSFLVQISSYLTHISSRFQWKSPPPRAFRPEFSPIWLRVIILIRHLSNHHVECKKWIVFNLMQNEPGCESGRWWSWQVPLSWLSPRHLTGNDRFHTRTMWFSAETSRFSVEEWLDFCIRLLISASNWPWQLKSSVHIPSSAARITGIYAGFAPAWGGSLYSIHPFWYRIHHD